MPVKSGAQAALAAMSRTPAGRAKLKESGKEPMPVNVADEMLQASKGMKFGSLPRHIRKKS